MPGAAGLLAWLCAAPAGNDGRGGVPGTAGVPAAGAPPASPPSKPVLASKPMTTGAPICFTTWLTVALIEFSSGASGSTSSGGFHPSMRHTRVALANSSWNGRFVARMNASFATCSSASAFSLR